MVPVQICASQFSDQAYALCRMRPVRFMYIFFESCYNYWNISSLFQFHGWWSYPYNLFEFKDFSKIPTNLLTYLLAKLVYNIKQFTSNKLFWFTSFYNSVFLSMFEFTSRITKTLLTKGLRDLLWSNSIKTCSLVLLIYSVIWLRLFGSTAVMCEWVDCGCCCVNWFSGRRRSCAVHNSIRASSSPTLSPKVKSTPLSCVSSMHIASRRTASSHYKHQSPWICRQCLSMSRSLNRQYGPQLTAPTAVVGCAMQGQSGPHDGCGCTEDDESGCRLLSEEIYTSRRKLRQPESLSRTTSQQQQHHTGSMSPSRTVLLLGAD